MSLSLSQMHDGSVIVVDEATKLIAKIRQCDIVIRDANRIHHFSRNGSCSCQDHF